MGLIGSVILLVAWIFGLLVTYNVLLILHVGQDIWNYWIVAVVLTAVGWSVSAIEGHNK